MCYLGESKGIQLVRKLKHEILGQWKAEFLKKYNGHQPEYTKLFNQFITNMVADQGSNAHNEYYRIDVTGWHSEEKSSYRSVKIYDWFFDYAIEYENNPNTWTYELLKLSFIRADVRLVVGYRDKDDRDNEVDIINEQLKWFKYPITCDEEFFVILMNMTPGDDVDPFNMRVYSIQDKNATEITDKL